MIRGMPTQEMDTSARSPSRETALAKPNTAPTCRQRHQTIRRSQRLDGGGGQALNGQQGRTEEPQQDHVEGNSQNTSLLVKASSTEAESKQTQTCAERVRQEGRRHTRRLIRVGFPGSDQASSGEGYEAREQRRPSRAIGLHWNPFCRPKPATRSDSAGWTTCAKQTSRQSRCTSCHQRNGCSLSDTQANRCGAQVRSSPTHCHRTRATDVSGRTLEDVKLLVCRHTARRGTTPCRASAHNAWQSLAHMDQSEGGVKASRAARDNSVTRSFKQVDWLVPCTRAAIRD